MVERVTFKSRAHVVLPLLLLAFLLAACSSRQLAQTNSSPSGIPVASQFSSFYNLYGGARVFGKPITEAFVVGDDGPLLQYFQSARLEYSGDPQQVDLELVRIFPLGEWAFAGLNKRLPLDSQDDGPSRYFPETDRTVQGDFLAFYEANNGNQTLGPPISSQLDRDGLRVQYFRNGRLDWYPELPEGEHVQPGPLGSAHFDAVMSYVYYDAMSQQFVPAANVTAVDVFAYVQHPILYGSDEQTLHLTILSPEGRSVSGLTVNITLKYGSTTQIKELELAENQNRLHLPLDTHNIASGMEVEVEISVFSSTGKVMGSENITFKTWW